MSKREKQRAAKKWAWERIIEVLIALRDSDWPFDDNEFPEIKNNDRKIYIDAIDNHIDYLSKSFTDCA